MTKWYTYWFEITSGEGEGEEFFTELQTADRNEHITRAKEIFPDCELRCLGRVSETEAEMMGLDTY